MAGVYNTNIPSSPALADPDANNLAPIAPPTVAGTPRQINDLTNAAAETEARKLLKKTNDNAVTTGEVAQSVCREFAVTAEYAAGLYGIGGAPAWAAPLLATVNAIDARVTAMDARQRLAIAQRRNLRNQASGGATPFQQLVKVNAGVGPPLPQRAPQGVAAAPVGTTYPLALAPLNHDALNSMTLDEISQLAEWANDDFGIVYGDLAPIQRNKLLQHYLYE